MEDSSSLSIVLSERYLVVLFNSQPIKFGHVIHKIYASTLGDNYEKDEFDSDIRETIRLRLLNKY